MGQHALQREIDVLMIIEIFALPQTFANIGKQGRQLGFAEVADLVETLAHLARQLLIDLAV